MSDPEVPQENDRLDGDQAAEEHDLGAGDESADLAEASEEQSAELSEGEVLEMAKEDTLDFLEGVLETMGLEGEVDAVLEEDGINASITGEDLGILIGRHGLTLNALQDLLRAAIQHQARDRVNVILDVEGYRERRREAVESQALEAAEQVAKTGGEVELEPMPAFERKVVHEVISGIEGISSFSEGEEPRRRVVIRSQE